MRKVLICFGLSLVAAGLFARDDHLVSMGVLEGISWEQREARSEGTFYQNPALSGSLSQTSHATALTFGLFLDLTYLEASVSLLGQMGKYRVSQEMKFVGSPSDNSDFELDTRLYNIDLRCLAKLPLRMGDVLVFPLFGPEYSNNISVNRSIGMSDEDVTELSGWFADLGGGVDLPLGDLYFLRLEGIYGINLNPLNHQVKRNFTGSYSDKASRLSLNLGFGHKL